MNNPRWLLMFVYKTTNGKQGEYVLEQFLNKPTDEQLRNISPFVKEGEYVYLKRI
jgi:hypothetical protein